MPGSFEPQETTISECPAARGTKGWVDPLPWTLSQTADPGISVGFLMRDVFHTGQAKDEGVGQLAVEAEILG